MSTRPATPRRPSRRHAAQFAALALLGASAASASCFPPTDPTLRALDRDTDVRPERAAAEVVRRLALPETGRDPLLVAQLHAIAAEAEVQASRPEAVKSHVDAGLAALAAAPAGAERERVGGHLQNSRAVQLILVGEAAAAESVLAAALREARPGSAGYSCLLAARSLLHLQARSLDAAAADALEAYEIATSTADAYARMNAAYHLAAIYSRAGLMSQAETMVAEVADYATREQATHLQTITAFLQARVFTSQRKHAEALVAARRARELAVQDGAPMGVAAATLSVCMALVGLREFAAAEPLCRGHEAEFVAAQRLDLLGEMRAQQARIALAGRRPRDAVRLLDAVLADGGTPVGPSYRARYLRYRADAHEARGDLAAVLADLRRAEELEAQVDALDRVNAVAVIGAMNERARMLAGQRELQARLDAQRRELATQRSLRNLSIAFSAAALLLVALLAYLLLQSMRQRQALRRRDAMLSTVVRLAPDALVLLDRSGRVRYANRHLFESGAGHLLGQVLTDSVHGPMAEPLRDTLASVYDRRAAASTLAVDRDAAGDGRYFEVHGAPVLEAGEVVGAVVRAADVTESHRVAREVVDASNRERLRLSTELHEGLGQQLAGVAMLAQGAVGQVDRGRPVEREALADIATHLSTAVATLRAAARELSPIAVERGSLGLALRRFARDYEGPGGTTVDAEAVDEELVLGDDAAEHLYRIAREAVITAVRDGGGRRVALGLAAAGDEFVLTVEDDGGAPSAAPSDRGLGLRMIEYRTRLLGGRVAIDRAAPRGTRIRVTVPRATATRRDA